MSTPDPRMVPDKPGWWWMDTQYDGLVPVWVFPTPLHGGCLAYRGPGYGKVSEHEHGWHGPCLTLEDVDEATAEAYLEIAGDLLGKAAENMREAGKSLDEISKIAEGSGQ